MAAGSADRRPSRVVADEETRRAQVSGLVAELVRLAERVGQPTPPAQHEVLRHLAVVHVLEVGGCGAAVDRVRIAQRTSASPAMWMTFEAPERSWSAWIPQSAAWVAQPLVIELLVRLHGDELEIDASLAGEHPILPHSTFVHPDGWWPAFKARELDGSTLGGVYRELLYPAVVEIVGRRPGRVLDLGGGDGELAALLFHASAASAVTLVDRNQALLVEARARLAGVDATVVDADLRSEAWTAAVGGPFEAIVAVGLFESNVLPADVARRVRASARALLAPGGLLVSTGTGASLLSRAQLEGLGLVVTNATLPAAEARGATYPFYVARRPE